VRLMAMLLLDVMVKVGDFSAMKLYSLEWDTSARLEVGNFRCWRFLAAMLYSENWRSLVWTAPEFLCGFSFPLPKPRRSFDFLSLRLLGLYCWSFQRLRSSDQIPWFRNNKFFRIFLCALYSSTDFDSNIALMQSCRDVLDFLSRWLGEMLRDSKKNFNLDFGSLTTVSLAPCSASSMWPRRRSFIPAEFSPFLNVLV
jgi:hypothetical protein